ncbi:uncharacterized protein EV422DRAFT_18561 [Fimicolochytrium jonesii]|uniref:uncharacterized protein n=1 Tax=Fimicolochytrium jonesii TaxID=1396493 RepID=UPI0022FECF46|nr:uncharacterized protein EV422DRAFT_18561 [Fimicolochytrium jonesii]KAI8826938.1 hypothetical protein EV422DRAFT_18561 [Fimicolochytrium jonesii]
MKLSLAVLTVFGLALCNNGVTALPSGALSRREDAQAAGVNKKQNEHHNNQHYQDNKDYQNNDKKAFSHQQDNQQHQAAAKKTNQKDLQADCFLTYENWYACCSGGMFTIWFLSMAHCSSKIVLTIVLHLGCTRNDYVDWDQSSEDDKKKWGKGKNKKNNAKQAQQHCVLTFDQIQTYEKIQKDRKQHENQQGYNKNGQKYVDNQQVNDKESIDHQLITVEYVVDDLGGTYLSRHLPSVLSAQLTDYCLSFQPNRRYCVAYYNTNWQQIEGQVNPQKKDASKLKQYALNKGQDYYNNNLNKNKNNQQLQTQCMVFEFQISAYAQWALNYNDGYADDYKKKLANYY